MSDILSLVANGLMPLPWWGYLVIALVFTHITIAAVTIYLHRYQSHRGLELHPLVGHFFRFWLWLTTGMVTKEWVAIHRKHHAKVESPDDPHSPQVVGIRKVLLEGTELYRAEAKNQETLQRYGHGTPADWIERNLYSRYTWYGCALMLIINFLLFGAIGVTIWAVQMMWIPISAAGIINGIGHYWGYRNFQCEDASRNIVPWGIIIGGEELHNNHHAYAFSAKLSSRWYEFDLGWFYIRILSLLKLADIRRVAPRLRFDHQKVSVDFDTLQAIITHRYAVLSSYTRSLKETCAQEIAKLRQRAHRGELLADVKSLHRLKQWIMVDAKALAESERNKLEHALANSKVLHTLYAMRQELTSLWERSTDSREQLLHRLQDWCRRAEASGIAPLQQFALRLRCYA